MKNTVMPSFDLWSGLIFIPVCLMMLIFVLIQSVHAFNPLAISSVNCKSIEGRVLTTSGHSDNKGDFGYSVNIDNSHFDFTVPYFTSRIFSHSEFREKCLENSKVEITYFDEPNNLIAQSISRISQTENKRVVLAIKSDDSTYLDFEKCLKLENQFRTLGRVFWSFLSCIFAYVIFYISKYTHSEWTRFLRSRKPVLIRTKN